MAWDDMLPGADLLREIGLVTVLSAQIEIELAAMFRLTVVGGDWRAVDALTAGMSSKQLSDALAATLDATIDDVQVKTQLQGLLRRVDKATEERNRVVHSLWTRYPTIGPDEGTAGRSRYTRSRRKGFKIDFTYVSIDELRAIAESIRSTLHDLAAFRSSLGRAMPGLVAARKARLKRLASKPRSVPKTPPTSSGST